MSDLLTLAERCEREEPAWELECEIGCAVQAAGTIVRASEGWLINRGTQHEPQWEPYKPPRYTTSLDAAVTLVPDGAEWNLTNLYGVAHSEVGLNFSDGNWQTGRHIGGHLALALCAAALRARAAMEHADE